MGGKKRCVPLEWSVVLDHLGKLWNHRVRQRLVQLCICKKSQCWMLCLHRHLTQEEHPLSHPYRRPRCNLHEVSASARYHPVQLQGSLKSPLAFWPRSLHSFRYGWVPCWVELRTASLQLGGKLSIDHGSSHCSWLLLNSSSNCIFRGHIYPRYVVLGGN